MASRVVEIVVHSDDLAVSVELAPLWIPRDAASTVIDIFVEMVRRRSGDLGLISGFARRERPTDDALRVI